MRYYSKLLPILLLLIITGVARGQEIQLSVQEIAELKKLSEYNTHWNTFLNVWIFLGPFIGFIVTWLGLRKKIDDWTEKEIVKKASEKFGVDWAIVKQLVDEKKHDESIKAKRLAIVNKETGRRQDLILMLEKYGFKSDLLKSFTLTDFNDKFDYNHFDLVIIDNYDNMLAETELRQIIDKYQFPYVLFTVEQASTKFFDDYKNKIKFAQIQQNIPDYIVQSF